MSRRHLQLPSALALVTVAAVAVGGCDIALDVGGPCASFGSRDSPCREQIYFPNGVSVDPGGDFLYVANGNSDLRYSGGSVQAIDLRKVECALAYVQGATGDVRGGCADLKLGEITAYRPAVDKVPAAGSRINPLDSVVECDETPFIVPCQYSLILVKSR